VRSDIDRLMQQRGLAGMVVLALDRYSPAFYYCTGQKIHHGFYVRTATGRAHLVHDPMERDQAALVGCEATSYAQRGYLQRVKSADSQAHALGELVAEVAAELGMKGRVAFTGDVPLGFGHQMLDHLDEARARNHGRSLAAGRAECRQHDEGSRRAGEDPPLLRAARWRR
jgi:hypothetical protein